MIKKNNNRSTDQFLSGTDEIFSSYLSKNHDVRARKSERKKEKIFLCLDRFRRYFAANESLYIFEKLISIIIELLSSTFG
jgi:hypothetical protein